MQLSSSSSLSPAKDFAQERCTRQFGKRSFQRGSRTAASMDRTNMIRPQIYNRENSRKKRHPVGIGKRLSHSAAQFHERCEAGRGGRGGQIGIAPGEQCAVIGSGFISAFLPGPRFNLGRGPGRNAETNPSTLSEVVKLRGRGGVSAESMEIWNVYTISFG